MSKLSHQSMASLSTMFKKDVVTKVAAPKSSNCVSCLEKLLADTYVLYVKTQSYHWNVTGPMFIELHAMFGGQYAELAGTVDMIAEHIRTLESFAPGSLTQFSKLSSIADDTTVPKAMSMVSNLLKDHETVIKSAEEVIKIAQAAGDEATADLGIRRVLAHKKTAWMLRSL